MEIREINLEQLIAEREQLIADRKGKKWVLFAQLLLCVLLIICTFAFSELYIYIIFATMINSSLLTANYCMIADMKDTINNMSILIQHLHEMQASNNVFNEKFYD